MSLILTRRIGETLYIGDNITITVADVIGNQVRFAINAPKEVAVHREEIYLKIQAERDTNTNKGKNLLTKMPLINRMINTKS